jgi:hypothetical protein
MAGLMRNFCDYLYFFGFPKCYAMATISSVVASEMEDSGGLYHFTNDLHEEEEATSMEEEECLVPPPSSWFDDERPTSPSDVGTNDVSFHTDSPEKEEEMPACTGKSYSSEPITPTAGDIRIPIKQTHYVSNTTQAIVGNTHPSPSWKEISSQVLPAAARELLSSSLHRMYYTARLSYARGRWHRKYSDIGNNMGGYSLSKQMDNYLPPRFSDVELPSFSSLPWVDRQLVKEWRSYLPDTPEELKDDDGDLDFEHARRLVPNPQPRPKWQKTDICHTCHKPFGPTRLRHHCRLCGFSLCQSHSSRSHGLPHLGYDPDVPERVCDQCKRILLEQNLAERVAWRLARCRDISEQNLTPYFETGLDSAEDIALRITRAALTMAKSIPLGAQATVAVETVDVLRKYGLHGIYGIMLRQEFLAAADLLRKALGINRTAWPLSVHELTAAIFYALAQHRAMRGLNPEREHVIHRFRSPSQLNDVVSKEENSKEITTRWTNESGARNSAEKNKSEGGETVRDDNYELSALSFHTDSVIDQTDRYNPDNTTIERMTGSFNSTRDPRRKENSSTDSSADDEPTFQPVCDPVQDGTLASLIFYAPIALNFIYATKEVDMQLLAAQQGWRLLYAYLDQDTDVDKLTDRPASAIFLHEEYKTACLAVRGTATINDVITDIRQIPVPFPDTDPDNTSEKEDDWTSVFGGQGLALCGMASAAVNLFREHVESLVLLVKQGYKLRLTGHSLGGGVATMLGVLVLRHLEQNQPKERKIEEIDLLRVYSYGTPSCVDARLAEWVDPFVTTVVLHDDVVPRLTPTSCRGLLKHLLHIRETWVKTHIEEDLRAVGERAKLAWAPRFRQPFTLPTSSRTIKKYCKKQILKGTKRLMSAKPKNPCGDPEDAAATTDDCSRPYNNNGEESFNSSHKHWGEKFFAPTSAISFIQSFEESGSKITHNEGEDDFWDAQEPGGQLLLEFLGGVDTRTEGIIIDGDEFFDTGENLLESESYTSDHSSSSIEQFCDPERLAASDSWSLEMSQSPSRSKTRASKSEDDTTKSSGDESNNSDRDPTAVVLEETPLPRMFIPGKIVHVYSHRGVYKCAHVPRAFRELRRISLAGNMLSNHTTKDYYEGLLEVQTARVAPEAPPRWAAFDEHDTW